MSSDLVLGENAKWLCVHNYDIKCGDRFGRLEVMGVPFRTRYPAIDSRRAVSKVILQQEIYAVVKCDCGQIKATRTATLRSGKSTSCGCATTEATVAKFTTHGMTKTRLYRIWAGMRKRIFNEKCERFYAYGERRISICDEWSDFGVFHSWAMANGYNDSLSIERENVNGNYEPTNCKWIPCNRQAANRRDTIWVEIDGTRMCLREFSRHEKCIVNYHRLWWRVRKLGWDIMTAATTP